MTSKWRLKAAPLRLRPPATRYDPGPVSGHASVRDYHLAQIAPHLRLNQCVVSASTQRHHDGDDTRRKTVKVLVLLQAQTPVDRSHSEIMAFVARTAADAVLREVTLSHGRLAV